MIKWSNSVSPGRLLSFIGAALSELPKGRELPCNAAGL